MQVRLGILSVFFWALSASNLALAGSFCGDDFCDADEDECSCTLDCPRTSCTNCGGCGFTNQSGCYCDALCVDFGDCCSDACTECNQCPAICGDGSCNGSEDSCNCSVDCPDDPNSCSSCECDVARSAGGVAGSNCACDAGCTDRQDCCANQCEVCGDCVPPTGACCFLGKGIPVCQPLSQSDCQNQGGSYNGDNTSCDLAPCTLGLGACCGSLIPGGGGVAGGSPGCTILPGYICGLAGGDYAGDGTSCGPDICNSGACCHTDLKQGPLGHAYCDFYTQSHCSEIGGTFFGTGTECSPNICERDQRVSTVKKGSLLIFPKVELRWDAAGVLTQDTIITLVNDFTKDVHVKLYFVNGDAPTEPIYADDLQTILVERAHNGWNQVDCVIELTENESTYLVMSTGVGGCQRFSILDPGTPPGRPNLEADAGRVLRGFVIAFAVDEDQNEISFNHLSGHADLIHYGLRSAWEYQSYAFQALNPVTGTWADYHPGELSLDGLEYDYAFNTLLFDFFAVGSTVFSNAGITVMLDTDLTLHPVSADLRQDSCGPITTKAHFDIWNANEDFRSGTARCITCWDQTLLSAYSVGNGLDNNFILADLGTDKGKARIDGVASFECDNLFVPPDLDDAILQWLLLHDRVCEVDMATSNEGSVAIGNGKEIDCCYYTINDSQNAALLGVAAKILSFSGGASGTTWAGMNLVGAGQQSAEILFDVPAPPETAYPGNDSSRGVKNVSERNSLSPSRGK